MNYLFYVEGLNKEFWFQGKTESAARKALFDSLTDAERNAVVQIECLDGLEIMPNSAMTNTEAAAIFNAAIADETNPDRIANVEIIREYFCNPNFRVFLETETARINGVI